MTELIMQVASMKTSRRYTRDDDDNTDDDNSNNAPTYCLVSWSSSFLPPIYHGTAIPNGRAVVDT